MSEQNSNSLSGLSENQAKEFHKLFVTSFIVFLVIAIIAHFLVWQWRPWIPGPEGYGAITEGINTFADSVINRFV